MMTSIILAISIFTNNHSKYNKHITLLATFLGMFFSQYVLSFIGTFYLHPFIIIPMFFIILCFYNETIFHILSMSLLHTIYYLCFQGCMILINNTILSYILFISILLMNNHMISHLHFPFTKISILLFSSLYITCVAGYMSLMSYVHNLPFPFGVICICVFACCLNAIYITHEYLYISRKIMNQTSLANLYMHYQILLQKQIDCQKEEKQLRYLRHDIINYLQTITTKQTLEGSQHEKNI